MSTVPHVNKYKKRLVAQANEKSCAICFRPTDVVLMSTDSKDWFYCCAKHLKDPGCASPIVDAAVEKGRLKQIEINKVKAEYELKQKKKTEAKEAEEEKDKKKSTSWLSNPFSGTKEEKPKTPEPVVPPAPEPTEFALHRTMYQHRVNLKQQAAQQKARDAQWATLQFPSVPGK